MTNNPFAETQKASDIAKYDTIWTVMVERVLVHKDGGLTFGFYNGSEIRIGA